MSVPFGNRPGINPNKIDTESHLVDLVSSLALL